MTVEEWLGEENKLGIDIYKKKYMKNGESFDEWLDRISAGDEDVKRLIIEKKFLFGGRILSNRGLGHGFSTSNCYVLAPPMDSIESIFDTAKQTARTFSWGGGVGFSIGKLAPRGARVNNTAITSSGAVSFMDLYSLVTGLISQNSRRGALMLSMPVSHPDIEEFIDIKTDLNRVTKANISIMVDSEFMEAAKNHKKYRCYFKREETGEEIEKIVDAYELLVKLSKNNWNYAEPGMLYWSKVNSYHLQSNTPGFEFAGVNP